MNNGIEKLRYIGTDNGLQRIKLKDPLTHHQYVVGVFRGQLLIYTAFGTSWEPEALIQTIQIERLPLSPGTSSTDMEYCELIRKKRAAIA